MITAIYLTMMNVPTLLKPSLCSLGLHNSQPQFGRLIIEFLPRLPSAQWPWQWHWNAISQYVWASPYEWRGNSVLGCSIIPAPASIIMLLIKSHQCRQIRVTLDPGSAANTFIFRNSCKAIKLCRLYFYYFCPYQVTWLTPPTISHLLSNNILFRKLIINISGSYYEAEAVYIIIILRHIVSRSIKRPPNSSHST